MLTKLGWARLYNKDTQNQVKTLKRKRNKEPSWISLYFCVLSPHWLFMYHTVWCADTRVVCVLRSEMQSHDVCGLFRLTREGWERTQQQAETVALPQQQGACADDHFYMLLHGSNGANWLDVQFKRLLPSAVASPNEQRRMWYIQKTHAHLHKLYYYVLTRYHALRLENFGPAGVFYRRHFFESVGKAQV